MKRISFTNRELVEKTVLNAITEIADVVGATLGPSGRPILIDEGGGKVQVTKDGVTVANAFQSSDSMKDLVANVARQSCQRTVVQAGDGTTTAIVLARALVESGQKFLRENPSYSPQLFARELKEILDKKIKPAIEAMAKPVRGLSPEEAKAAVRHVAMVSANHDAELADAVAEATEFVGEDGMVIAEEGTGLKTTVEKRAGFPINGGLHSLGGSASSAFVNRTAYEDCVLEGAYVAAYDGEINDFNILVPLLERIAGEQKDGVPFVHPIVVVAHGFGPQVLKAMATNFRSAGGVKCVPFISSRNGQASGKQAFLYDLTAYVGGRVFDPQVNLLQNAWPVEGQLGFVEKIKIGQHETVILAEPELEPVQKRIHELKDQMDGASDFDKDRIRYRIGQLSGGVATIFAGGATAAEAKERHARVVDAISAVRSAMEMGVVPGGGAALVEISRQFEAESPSSPASILANALKRPFMQIVLNSGHAKTEEEAMAMTSGLGEQGGWFAVFDALKGEQVEWYSSGIMDPAKVTLMALSNALSVAQLLMTLGGMMVANYADGELAALAMQENLIKAAQEGMG